MRKSFTLVTLLLLFFISNQSQAQSCTASFFTNVGSCPLATFFNNSSASPGPISSYHWDFGDGDTANTASPNHVYTANGTYTICLTITAPGPCTSTMCDTINISCIGGAPASCNSLFGFNSSGCPTIQFSDSSTSSPGTVNIWTWNFGDGGSSSLQNPSHTYTANGQYTVCLQIKTTDNCDTFYCDTLQIGCITGPVCNAAFTVDSSMCPTLNFTDASIASPGIVKNWQWDFGDGNTDTTQNPSHSYTTNGTYLVCLSMETSAACFDTVCQTITISCIGSVSCSGNFSVNSSACPTFGFTDISTASGNIINWDWDFGDGGSSLSQNPSHAYTSNGTYIVCLTINTDDSCFNTYCDTLNISCIVGSICTADFSYNMSGCPSVQFSDSSSTIVGVITSHSWDFGDGGSDNTQNPSHTYTSNGNYIVCLTITTSTSCTNTYCDTVSVTCIPTNCNAGFSSLGTGCPTISFSDTSSSSPGSIVSWAWDFGDGGSSASQSPSHTYTANGNFNVCLIITTNDLCTDTVCNNVNVSCISGPTCTSLFQTSLAGCPQASFTNISSSSPGTIVSYAWTFGDGNSASSQHANHTYAANGNYPVCLTIVTADSCTSTYCDTISVSCITVICNADFLFMMPTCPAVNFSDISTTNPGTVNSWAWDFGDGNSSNMQHPAHTYTANGNFNVCLIIGTSGLCTDTICKTVSITCIAGATCTALFSADTSFCPNIPFTDLSQSSPGTIVSWAWTFGDGGTANTQSPSHVYTTNGNYLTCLTIVTSDSCSKTYCDTIPIVCNAPPTCSAGFQFVQPNCSTLNFFDGTTTASGDSVVSWSWDFGDGNSSSMKNPSNTYASNGNWIVCLTITTANACTNIYCDTITVNCTGSSSCAAGFSYSMGNCPAIAFTDQSSSTPGSIVSWSWNFGDGSTSNMQNPTHSYTSNNGYNVCLTITTSDSCTDVFCDSLVISCITGAQCQAGFTFDDSNSPAIVFTDVSTSSPGAVISWAWDFGDGGSSSIQNPSYTYAAPGNNVVCLTITTADSCVSTFCDTVVSLVEVQDLLGNGVSINLYPNPVNSELIISYSGATSIRLEFDLVNALGQKVQSATKSHLMDDGKLSMDVTNLSEGIYFVRIKAGEEMTSRKIIIRH